MLTIKQIINEPIPSNCFVLYDKTVGRDCVIVDPGSKYPDTVFEFLEKEGLIPIYIILTHEHFDHCWGVNDIVKKFNTPIICSEICAVAIQSDKGNCSVFYDNKERFTINHKTIAIEDIGNKLVFNGDLFHFINTPGHTKASICFYVNNMIFSGDTLINGERTVTKLPTSSKEDLKQTLSYLRNNITKEYTVFSGHGDCFLFNPMELDGFL